MQLLAKEQEVEEKTGHLKTTTAEMESLKTEVSRLRRYEDELNDIQVSCSLNLKLFIYWNLLIIIYGINGLY